MRAGERPRRWRRPAAYEGMPHTAASGLRAARPREGTGGGLGRCCRVGRYRAGDGYAGAWSCDPPAVTLRSMHDGRLSSRSDSRICGTDPEVSRDGHTPQSAARSRGARADRDASFDWVAGLTASAAEREEVIADLYALLLRGARFELARRRESLGHIARSEQADLATQAADDALVAILAKLDTFRGTSRFTTWAYKFVILEAGVKARRRAWHGREVTLDDEGWATIADAGSSAHEALEHAELIGAIRDAMSTSLTTRQREVFSALALNGVPIDVLAERLGTTRGALYTTLHGARHRLRRTLADAGLPIDAGTVGPERHVLAALPTDDALRGDGRGAYRQTCGRVARTTGGDEVTWPAWPSMVSGGSAGPVPGRHRAA
jgi:RNA polymerase sigma-70 factor, ECF subfamily